MGYTKYEYRVVKLDKQPYYPRADDPMETLVKPQWEKALFVSKMWHSERVRKSFFGNDEVAKQVRPTLLVGGPIRGAKFCTANEFERVPYGDNESDLRALKLEAERRYKNATLSNTSTRIQQLLGMLGDVRVIEKKDNDFSVRSKVYQANYKAFEVKDCVLILFEPELEDA